MLPPETESPEYRPGLQFSRIPRNRSPLLTRGGDRMGTLITHFVIFHSDWCSGSRDWSFALHWSFVHGGPVSCTACSCLFGSRHSWQAGRIVLYWEFSRRRHILTLCWVRKFRLKLPAAQSIGFPAWEEQSFPPARPGPCCRIQRQNEKVLLPPAGLPPL